LSNAQCCPHAQQQDQRRAKERGAIEATVHQRAKKNRRDGETDIPSMKMVTSQGGCAIAVLDPYQWNEPRSLDKISRLISEERVSFVAPADYQPMSQLDVLVKGALGRIARRNGLLRRWVPGAGRGLQGPQCRLEVTRRCMHVHQRGEQARARRDVVLGLLHAAGAIADAQRAAARAEPLRAAPARGATNAAPYFVDFLRSELQSAYPPDLLIEVPRTTCRSLDFHRADEVIAVGRDLAARALDHLGDDADDESNE
jgi:hypothetical protein